MGAGVAELQGQLAAVNVQLATAALTPDVRAELLARKEAMEAELMDAKAKKSADSASGGAYGLLSSFYRAPPTQLRKDPSPARPARTPKLH